MEDYLQETIVRPESKNDLDNFELPDFISLETRYPTRKMNSEDKPV